MNFQSLVMCELISTSSKLWSLGSKTPTPSAFMGAKMTFPLFAVAAPLNFHSIVMCELMFTSSKLLSRGSKTPTPFACAGAKTTLPSFASAAE